MGTKASYTQERRLKQNTETLEATGTPIATAGQSSSDGDLLSLRSHRHACRRSQQLTCHVSLRIGHFMQVLCFVIILKPASSTGQHRDQTLRPGRSDQFMQMETSEVAQAPLENTALRQVRPAQMETSEATQAHLQQVCSVLLA